MAETLRELVVALSLEKATEASMFWTGGAPL